jgi:hypothetical protein
MTAYMDYENYQPKLNSNVIGKNFFPANFTGGKFFST